METEQIQKTQFIVNHYQQLLANEQLQTASLSADLQITKRKLDEALEKLARYEAAPENQTADPVDKPVAKRR
jgi:predicted transcriptional regulator